jgi:ribonucleoside-diphosphate reductase alpha chain
MLYQGRVPEWDVSEVRPSGARLKTFGGRASGPEPLEDLFRFAIGMFTDAAGRRLTSIECHDLCCKIGEVVVVGGVRRSALISLSNPSDDRMRHAKSGDWRELTPWRRLANNSACYTEKPGMDSYMREWLALYDSKSGERGIFNRVAAQNQAKKFGRRDPNWAFGCNPCSEIFLRPDEFCNLTEVVVRKGDSVRTLERKIRLATILGTMQATLTHFRYLRPTWKQNTEDERLLGVSLTGVMDHELLNGSKGNGDLSETLERLRAYAVKTNKEWARKLDIAQAAAVTCNKPSGTVSQLVDCASGIHSRHSPYWLRNVRADKKDPLAQMMASIGFPHEDDVTKPEHNLVFPFPIKAPAGAVTSADQSALAQLKTWKTYQDHWCEHKPSCTVTVKESEWMGVGSWVYDNFDQVSGISFLPAAGHVYKQTPYQECTKREFDEAQKKMPKNVDWSGLDAFEVDDSSVNYGELACSGPDGCELVDIVKG